MSEFVPVYDLESLNEAQRQEYVKTVCKHMGVPDNLNLVMLTYLDEQEGPRRLVAYAKRGAAEIIRNSRGINITGLKQERVGGSIVWTVTAQDSKGRQEMSSGSKWIDGLNGKELDDAIMTAQTRACRRVTLQFVGAGVLDESEVNPSAPVISQETKFTAVAAAPQPTVAPSNQPGKDVTVPAEPKLEDITIGHAVISPEDQAKFSAEQEKLRQDAIAQLNAKHQASQPAAESVKRTRKPRTPKTIDMGPSEVPAAATPPAAAPEPAKQATPVQQSTAVPSQSAAVAVTPPTATSAAPGTRPRLTLEQMKPFRQRQFKFVNELEENGFAPKEGMGNQDKLRAFVGMLFPEVTNFNELTIEQWEKYLTTVESKITTIGPKQTITYIEDAIGI